MNENKCCGNCKHFDGVIEGVAWCPLYLEYRTDNEEGCVWHHPRNNGWTEITPDNVDELRKNKKNAVIMNPKEWNAPEIACLITEENLSLFPRWGGYYYYVLPELKIE